MKEEILEIKAALEACFTVQSAATAAWHETEPPVAEVSGEYSVSHLRNLVLLQHARNFQLWHVEDSARRTDVPDSVIASCKRQVDMLNQQRNDCIEEVDKCLVHLLAPHLPQETSMRQNTETVGIAVDRLSILALKVFHMDEQTKRTDVTDEHLATCSSKLAILRKQREDLARSVLELVSDYALGQKVPALYSQFKMYNDPALNPELYTKKATGSSQ